MKTYISGLIQSPLTEIDKVKFNNAESYLKKNNHDPVNILQISPNKLLSWPVRNEILSVCDAIYLLTDWLQSEESQMEKHYSAIWGKTILFESQLMEQEIAFNNSKEIALKIESAIHEVTGLTLADYYNGSREETGFFARMIFIHHCSIENIDPEEIIRFIDRDITTIDRCIKKYEGEYKFNRKFREIAEKVNQKMRPALCNCETTNQ